MAGHDLAAGQAHLAAGQDTMTAPCRLRCPGRADWPPRPSPATRGRRRSAKGGAYRTQRAINSCATHTPVPEHRLPLRPVKIEPVLAAMCQHLDAWATHAPPDDLTYAFRPLSTAASRLTAFPHAAGQLLTTIECPLAHFPPGSDSARICPPIFSAPLLVTCIRTTAFPRGLSRFSLNIRARARLFRQDPEFVGDLLG
jgi:hypothetical protein